MKRLSSSSQYIEINEIFTDDRRKLKLNSPLLSHIHLVTGSSSSSPATCTQHVTVSVINCSSGHYVLLSFCSFSFNLGLQKADTTFPFVSHSQAFPFMSHSVNPGASWSKILLNILE